MRKVIHSLGRLTDLFLRLWDFTLSSNDTWSFTFLQVAIQLLPQPFRKFHSGNHKSSENCKQLQISCSSLKARAYGSTIWKTLWKKMHPWQSAEEKTSQELSCFENYIRHTPNTALNKKNTTPTTGNGSGSVMLWGSGAVSAPGCLAINKRNMDSALYRKILKENVRSSVCDLKLKLNWFMQQENDLKHKSD